MFGSETVSLDIFALSMQLPALRELLLLMIPLISPFPLFHSLAGQDYQRTTCSMCCGSSRVASLKELPWTLPYPAKKRS